MIHRKHMTEKSNRNEPYSENHKVIIIGDTVERSLHLHISKFKKTYRFVTSYKGKRINDSIGECPATKLSDMRNDVKTKRVEMINGSYQIKTLQTVNQALDTYLVPYYKNCVKDSKSALSSINRFARKYFGEMLITDVDHDLAQSKVFELMAEEKAPETIRKLVLYPKKLYKKLIKYGDVVVNPFDDLDLPKVSNIRDVTLNPVQRPDWFKCCIAENSVASDAVLIQYLQALRVNEAISIKVSDISADFKTLKLPETKSRKAQYVATCSFVQELLKRRVSKTWNQFVFPSEKHTDRHITSPRGAFNRIKKRMAALGHDVSTLTQHDQRRTNSSACAEVTGGDVHMVAKHIRHSNPSILHRYVHYQSDAVAAVSEATAQALINPTQNEEK